MPPTVIEGDYEWASTKADSNEKEHGVGFDEAATVLDDPNVQIFDDGGPGGRFIAIGQSVRGRVLTVVHVPRGQRDRIISARKATSAEQRIYFLGALP